MSIPNRGDKKTYLGSDGRPTNDTDPCGGGIDTGTAIDENNIGNLFGSIRLGSSDVDYYTIFYIKMEHSSPGYLDFARFNNRAGARPNSTSGNASIISTNSVDDGQVIITGKVSGTWTQETLTLNGTTPVIGSQVWDSDTVVRWQFISGVPVGLITCSVNSSVCGVIWGTDNDPADAFPSISTYTASAEMQFALANSLNMDLYGDNRLTAPSDIGSFSTATRWSGEDFSINVPGDQMYDNDYIGVCARFTAYADIPAPYNGKLQFKHNLVGDAKES